MIFLKGISFQQQLQKELIKMEDVKCGQRKETVAEFAFQIEKGRTEQRRTLLLRPLCSPGLATPTLAAPPGRGSRSQKWETPNIRLLSCSGVGVYMCKSSEPLPTDVRCVSVGTTHMLERRPRPSATRHFSTFLAFFRMSHFFLLGRRHRSSMLGIHS